MRVHIKHKNKTLCGRQWKAAFAGKPGAPGCKLCRRAAER